MGIGAKIKSFQRRRPVIKFETAVKIDPPCDLDEGVILGNPPDREIENISSHLGANARIRSGSIIYAGVTIGANFQAGHHVLIREENHIGDNVSIWSNTVVDYGCKIGSGAKIHCNVYIPQFTTIENDVFIAPGCVFANDMHPGCPDFRDCMQGPTIKHGAKIGAGVTIIPKVTIGEYALIGAGSVITKDVPAYGVVTGNPARVSKSIGDLRCKSGRRNNPYDKREGGFV